MEIVIGIILILASVFLIAAVLMQQGKSRNLSGAIGGGSSDTFLGKTGASSLDKKLSRLTTIVAIVFVVLVVVMYLMQDTSDYSGIVSGGSDTTAADTAADDTAEDTSVVGDTDVNGEDTTAAGEDTTAAAEG